MRQLVSLARGVVAAALVLGFVAEVQAAAPRGMLLQRRGRMSRVPARPAIVDSSPTIDTLNKALKALGATDRDYDGHREKAVTHIASAIRHLETATGRGKSNAAIDQAATGKPAAATKTASTPEAASDDSLRKAKAILFAVHHDLTQHTSSRGQIRADAEIRTAIDEIVAALKPGTASPTANAVAAPAASATAKDTISTTPVKPAK